ECLDPGQRGLAAGVERLTLETDVVAGVLALAELLLNLCEGGGACDVHLWHGFSPSSVSCRFIRRVRFRDRASRHRDALKLAQLRSAMFFPSLPPPNLARPLPCAVTLGTSIGDWIEDVRC